MARNVQHNREYQREWARRKRAGLPTRIVNKPKKTKEKFKEEYNSWKRKDRENIYLQRKQVWGDRCYLCSRETNYLVLHNKAGKNHDTNYYYIKSALKNPNDWVRLCKSCHTGVHFCMNFLKMKWEDIENKINSSI